MRHRLSIKNRADKDLEKLPKRLRSRILEKISALGENPFPSGSKKLRFSNSIYRLRVGDYRVLYQVNSEIKTVLVARIAHRSKVYKSM